MYTKIEPNVRIHQGTMTRGTEFAALWIIKRTTLVGKHLPLDSRQLSLVIITQGLQYKW